MQASIITNIRVTCMYITSGIMVLSGIIERLVALLTNSAGDKKNLWALVSSLVVAPGTNGNACNFLGNFSDTGFVDVGVDVGGDEDEDLLFLLPLGFSCCCCC